jgi:hypothetical protein
VLGDPDVRVVKVDHDDLLFVAGASKESGSGLFVWVDLGPYG